MSVSDAHRLPQPREINTTETTRQASQSDIGYMWCKSLHPLWSRMAGFIPTEWIGRIGRIAKTHEDDVRRGLMRWRESVFWMFKHNDGGTLERQQKNTPGSCSLRVHARISPRTSFISAKLHKHQVARVWGGGGRVTLCERHTHLSSTWRTPDGHLSLIGCVNLQCGPESNQLPPFPPTRHVHSVSPSGNFESPDWSILGILGKTSQHCLRFSSSRQSLVYTSWCTNKPTPTPSQMTPPPSQIPPPQPQIPP